jgi:aquaporin Z
MRLLRPAVAEFIGIFFLVFIGVGAIVTNEFRPGSVGLLGIAAAHGVALMVGVTATMHISGAHLNPAVTLGLWSVGRVDVRTAATYVVAQLAGAIAAAAAVKFLFPPQAVIATGLGTPELADGVTLVQAILIEALMTFLLAFAIMGTAVDARARAAGRHCHRGHGVLRHSRRRPDHRRRDESRPCLRPRPDVGPVDGAGHLLDRAGSRSGRRHAGL